jgi:hypothetical protein
MLRPPSMSEAARARVTMRCDAMRAAAVSRSPLGGVKEPPGLKFGPKKKKKKKNRAPWRRGIAVAVGNVAGISIRAPLCAFYNRASVNGTERPPVSCA